jgi:hypothetical protein
MVFYLVVCNFFNLFYTGASETVLSPFGNNTDLGLIRTKY